MSKDSFENWVDAYISIESTENHVSENHSGFWAVEKFMNDVHSEPENCWEAILEILKRKPSDRVIGLLSAGPLEDLIEYHGGKFIDRIELEARRNPDFRHLLGGVWESSTPEIWKRIEAARISAW